MGGAVCFLWHFPSNDRSHPSKPKDRNGILPDVIRHTALRSSDFPPRPFSRPSSILADRRRIARMSGAAVRSGCLPIDYNETTSDFIPGISANTHEVHRPEFEPKSLAPRTRWEELVFTVKLIPARTPHESGDAKAAVGRSKSRFSCTYSNPSKSRCAHCGRTNCALC
jgi:hypothetical protein